MATARLDASADARPAGAGERDESARSSGSLKALLWRFHFYVGVLVAPILILTSLSGILYVFAPQIEEVVYAKLFRIAPVGGKPALTLDEQLTAFRESRPDARVQTVTPSFSPERSVALSFAIGKGGGGGGEHDGHNMGGKKPESGTAKSDEGGGKKEKKEPLTTAFVNPQTGALLGTLDEESRFKPWMKRFHKTYLGGENGRIVTELGTSWLMVLLLTGFVLWFPSKASRVAGVWVPRLKGASRLKWRDFHSILGAYLLLATLALCFTGLTWSRFSGNYRRSFQKAIGQESAFRIKPPKAEPHDGGATKLSLAEIQRIAEGAGAARPYKITLPKGPTGVYGVQTFDDPAFTESLTVFVDPYTGKVLGKKGRGSTPPVAQFFSMGVAFHEGRLFGLTNQLLCALAAGTIIFSTISGLVMWKKRSPQGVFRAPKAMSGVRIPTALWIVGLVLGAFLPVASVSLILILVLDRLVLTRFGNRKEI